MSGGGGNSGTQTPQVQNSSTITEKPAWYNNLVHNLSNTTATLGRATPAIEGQFWGGGTAPAGGVWNGGQTQMGYTPAQAPIPIPLPTVSGTQPAYSGPTGPGGFPVNNTPPNYSANQGMGAGIGSSFGASKGGALSSFNKSL